jgi:uncharacterized membrane protein YfcA
MAEILIAIAIGFVAGILSGLFGIGGGLVIIPSLIYILKFNQHLAQGTSLVALLLPVGLLAVIKYYKSGNVDIKVGLLIGLGLFIGAFVGAIFANNLSDTTMRKAFAAFIVLVGIKLFFN